MTKRTHTTHTSGRDRTARTRRFLRRHGWWIGLVVLLGAVVLGQIFYPPQYTLPLARYNHEPYGLKHRDELMTHEQKRFAQTKVELQLSDTKERTELRKLGAKLRETTSFDILADYPRAWRFVPFSILFYRPDVTELPVHFSEAPLKEFVQQMANKYARPAKDATLELKESEVQAIAATIGRTVDTKTLVERIRQADYDISGIERIIVPEQSVAPKATAADLEPLRQEAEGIIAKRIVLVIDGQIEPAVPTREQLVSWLKLGQRDGERVIELNHEAIVAYVGLLNKEYGHTSGETLVSIVDGREQARQEGKVGRQISTAAFEQKISSALFNPGQYKYIPLVLENVAPSIRTAHSYTNSQDGVQAKINQLGARYDMRLSLQQLDGAGWQASYRGDESTPSASTYKLYVALKLFEEMDAGRTSWNSAMLDTTVAGCFDRMIIMSTNQCAEQWLNTFGRAQLNTFLYQRGVSQSTTFTAQGAVRTSADDLLRTVRGIYDASLVNGPNRQKLLDMMSRQVWRKGIPTGTAGRVSNKVGFLWDYVHDAGVVHHPRGTYVLAVMTKGASYATIAQITRELEALMYP